MHMCAQQQPACSTHSPVDCGPPPAGLTPRNQLVVVMASNAGALPVPRVACTIDTADSKQHDQQVVKQM
jgi:hypothetical protein